MDVISSYFGFYVEVVKLGVEVDIFEGFVSVFVGSTVEGVWVITGVAEVITLDTVEVLVGTPTCSDCFSLTSDIGTV